MNLTQKIIQAHLAGADSLPPAGASVSLRIDQTLTQDSTGTMAYLQLEAPGSRANTRRTFRGLCRS